MPTDVAGVLAEQNIEAAPGNVGERNNNTFQYTLRYRGRLEEPEQYENMVIKATADGKVIRLKDIARVELGSDTYASGSRTNGHTAVSCMVSQIAGSNATEIVQSIQKQLDEVQGTLPTGLEIRTVMNVNDFLFASIHEVVKTLIEAFVLVFLVVFLFLQDLRSTLIPTIAIPVALIGTFFALYIIGFSINLLTLSAMILAIAIVVDDAIVVVEGVHAKLDMGYTSARKASLRCNERTRRSHYLHHPRDDGRLRPGFVLGRHQRYVLSPVWYHHGHRHRFLCPERTHPLASPLRHLPQGTQR